jgi:hypothetical protein
MNKKRKLNQRSTMRREKARKERKKNKNKTILNKVCNLILPIPILKRSFSKSSFNSWNYLRDS